jgi:transmembrane sensor
MSSVKNHLPKSLLQEAAEWYWTIREEGVGGETIDEWQSWLSASPNHKRAFERIQSALEVADEIESPSWPSGEELVADQFDGSMSIKSWLAKIFGPESVGNESTSKWNLDYSHVWAIAASLFLVIIVGAVFQYRQLSVSDAPPDYVLYQTQAAEHREVILPDDSIVSLGGKSTISVAYHHDRRVIVLQQGEAYFDVAKDESRPFVVEARGREIIAIGTAFNVSNQHARVVVTVTEGTVIVAPESRLTTGSPIENRDAWKNSGETARLEAGQKLSYDDKTLMPISIAEPGDALAWRNGLLKYRGEKLEFVIEDVERYIDYPIILASPAVGEIQYTGTVFQNSADTWVYGLEDAFSLVVSEAASGIVVDLKTDE